MPRDESVQHDQSVQAVWLPPAKHDVKINVDGGLSKVGDRGASAVICRDRHGMFLGASAVIFEGLLDPTTLEAQACNEALALAADLHAQSVCVASDSLEVITNIHTGAPCN